jgi:hypothetical protein
MARQAGNTRSLGHTLMDQNNYLRDKRKDTPIHGEVVSILRYFANKLMITLLFNMPSR